MNRTALDLWVGLFVAIGLAALMFLALKVGNLAMSGTGDTYVISARFDNIGGLKVRAPVKSAGVVVGRVKSIQFDPATYLAVVEMALEERYQFPRDTFGKIRTSGLLGEQYIAMDVGGDIENLKAGDMLKKTESAIVIEDMIGQFLFDKASEAPAK